jgi:hypothetical protein
MAGGQDYSKTQKKIINRYYENEDSIASLKLGELVSDIYLCEDAKKAEKLWQRVGLALAHTKANPAEVRKLLEDKDVQRLAKLVGTLA